MRTETKWAFIAAIALFIWLVLAKMLNWHSAENFGTGMVAGVIFSVLLFVVVYYMTCLQKREQEYNGVMSWAEGFWACARMTLIFIPLSTLVILLYMTAIHPDFGAIYAAKVAEMGQATGKDPINDHLAANTQSALLFGGLFSLIFPLFTRKNPV